MTGAGGAVTQGTSKATGVTLNAVTGTITLAAGATSSTTTTSFTLTNSAIAATDIVVVNHRSVGALGAYSFAVTPGAGSAVISIRSLTTLDELLVLQFAVIKSVVA